MELEAVIFDWGGTLTRWHDIDFHAESLALAAAVTTAGHDAALRDGSSVASSGAASDHAAALHRAGEVIWGRSREHQRSATIADLFDEAGLEHDPALLTAYREFWEPHTYTDPDARPALAELRAAGLRIGVLSNTIWSREWHVAFFERDGLYDLIDGDVYTSEIPWTKPSTHAFRAAMDAVGATDPRRCVYVGDRLFDDVWGAQEAGLRAVHVPHSDIPDTQIGHSEGVPDGVVSRLIELPELLSGW